ncbi:MAG: sulfite reductase subunit C [Peptococcaceae bacterium]|nr:MAG: sulfite reductase subunit C [Peptococcaceae bacterium]
MSLDPKTIIKNAFFISKNKGQVTARVRVPGGHLEVKYLDIIKEIAGRYGNGTVHCTTRQALAIPGIPAEKIPAVKKLLAPYIQGVEVDSGVDIKDLEGGFPAPLPHNITACIGSRDCVMSAIDTTDLALKLERSFYPGSLVLKMGVSGCANDCAKVHLQDVGIISMVEPLHDAARCVSCESCVKNCAGSASGALRMENHRVVRDDLHCLGCGECVLKCPSGAWSSGSKYYRVMIGGWTGRKHPRMAATFLEWTEEDAVFQVIRNIYAYIEKHKKKDLLQERLEYIIERTGYGIFKQEVLPDLKPGSKARVARYLNFGGYPYDKGSQFES